MGGVRPPVGVTGQAPLPEKDPEDRGDIDAELARLAAQRALEIQASVAARQPLAWIAIDDLDLRPPSDSTLCMGYPHRQPKVDVSRVGDAPAVTNGRGLPPLAPRHHFLWGSGELCCLSILSRLNCHDAYRKVKPRLA